jgi:membrane glycosyltransferase
MMNTIPAPSERARTAPPLVRGAITPAPWFGFWRGLLFALWPGQRWPAVGQPPAWQRAARQRRRLLIALVVALSGAALMLRIDEGGVAHDALWWSTSALMTLLFAWVGVGCATACMGMWALWRGDPHAPVLRDPHAPIDALARTALVMPICNEDIAEVFAGLRATCESLLATGEGAHFDVFVLSDTSQGALREAEQRAWQRLRAMLADSGESVRLYYRWRKRRTKRKSGNVADFCRRWGRAYRYMVVLDADSTMSGDTLVQLVRMMEQHPRAGIIQTLPQIARPATLHARAQQFASRVSGRLFALGMAWWQLGDAHYWGHNAIIRVEPFMRHCGLARVPGRGSLAGEILSHDFVEAALMGRAGYEVWLAPQLDGSWECSPSNLLDELQRDRRWCQGNLQNFRLVAEPGWRSAHRAMFSVGALSYLVAPLWLIFIVLGLASGGPALGDAGLWLLTLGLLLLPRALGVAAIVARGEAHAFGGAWRLTSGAALELLLSSLQAPLRMLAHCLYVLGALTGLKLEWKSPPRGERALGWVDATRRVGALVALPLAAGWGLVQRTAAVALAPMLLPLTLAVPFTVLTGHPRAGRAVARLGLLRTPEEERPPRPVARAGEHAGFTDLVPPPAAPAPIVVPPRRSAPRPVAARTHGWRHAPAAAMAAVALLTIGVPRDGIAPELSPQLRVEHELNLTAYWRDLPSLPPVTAQQPLARKRMVVRDKPARMIDNAIRQRAIEAVERALASEAPPT